MAASESEDDILAQAAEALTSLSSSTPFAHTGTASAHAAQLQHLRRHSSSAQRPRQSSSRSVPPSNSATTYGYSSAMSALAPLTSSPASRYYPSTGPLLTISNGGGSGLSSTPYWSTPEFLPDTYDYPASTMPFPNSFSSSSFDSAFPAPQQRLSQPRASHDLDTLTSRGNLHGTSSHHASQHHSSFHSAAHSQVPQQQQRHHHSTLSGWPQGSSGLSRHAESSAPGSLSSSHMTLGYQPYSPGPLPSVAHHHTSGNHSMLIASAGNGVPHAHPSGSVGSFSQPLPPIPHCSRISELPQMPAPVPTAPAPPVVPPLPSPCPTSRRFYSSRMVLAALDKNSPAGLTLPVDLLNLVMMHLPTMFESNSRFEVKHVESGVLLKSMAGVHDASHVSATAVLKPEVPDNQLLCVDFNVNPTSKRSKRGVHLQIAVLPKKFSGFARKQCLKWNRFRVEESGIAEVGKTRRRRAPTAAAAAGGGGGASTPPPPAPKPRSRQKSNPLSLIEGENWGLRFSTKYQKAQWDKLPQTADSRAKRPSHWGLRLVVDRTQSMAFLYPTKSPDVYATLRLEGIEAKDELCVGIMCMSPQVEITVT